MPDISKFDAAAVERITIYKNAVTSISNNWLLGSSYLIDPRGQWIQHSQFFSGSRSSVRHQWPNTHCLFGNIIN